MEKKDSQENDPPKKQTTAQAIEARARHLEAHELLEVVRCVRSGQRIDGIWLVGKRRAQLIEAGASEAQLARYRRWGSTRGR